MQGTRRCAGVLVLAVLLAGCSAGKYFTWSQARQLHLGMTEAEVQAIMGPPSSMTALATPEGPREKWVWVYVNMLSGSTKSLVVSFADGKVVQVPVIPDSFGD